MPAADTPPLVFEHVSKTYPNGTRALADLTLAVGARQFVALLGPSGCGKSTLLRLAAGLETADAGRVLAPERDVGFVFQDPTLMPWATVADNVALPLRFARLPAADVAPRVATALARVGLSDAAALFPRELSGGMRMRVSIARAIVTRPRLLLMDEPFAALDEIGRFRLDGELVRLAERERWTVVFVTHSVYEAVFLANRVVVMAAAPGRVVADVPIAFDGPRDDELRDRPEFAATCAHVSALLRRAVDGAATGRSIDTPSPAR